MFSTLLIANRGEIACRIIRTARRMGVRTIAVHSDADADALHVRMADAAVHIGPSSARESYLVGDRIIAAAIETGASAVHPGYGFLSENAAFARAVIRAGLIWVGPDPSSIDAMGLKDAAKRLMQAAGVPTTPGYLGDDQSPGRLEAEAGKVGYPVLIKAVAGGGGKGMRRVDRAGDFAEALLSCQREAAASFGDDRVLIEKYVLSPRHIEVQVFGDRQGSIVHLFERDCSLQRRHQKVIEEAPAPGMDEMTRAVLCKAAVQAARAVNYVGAGTVEFIADASEGLRPDRIWFMEMNTRLQVEHPVTEAITGVDLVEWQLRVAAGEALPVTQPDLVIQGWAMEARLYAEDPVRGFLPSTGRLDILRFGQADGGRIDTGVEQGGEVSPFYDPMIAKVIASGFDRDQARERLSRMLADTAVWPVKTNAAFLLNTLNHPDFVAGAVDTGLIERDASVLTAAAEPSAEALALAATEMVAVGDAAGFRLNRAPATRAFFLLDGEPVEARIDSAKSGDATGSVQARSGEAASAFVMDQGQVWRLMPWRKTAAAGSDASGLLLAPMPGRIIAVDVAAGDRVSRGDRILVLEAMKMEHSLAAPFDGVVVELSALLDGQVQVDAILARIEQDDA